MSWTARGLAAVLALAAWAGGAWGIAPIQIQLHDIIAPVALQDGRRTTTTITFFLGVGRDRDVEAVCRRLPVVRDALVVAVNREPVPAFGRHLDAEWAAPRLRKAVNDALGAPLVRDIHMIPGVPREKTHIAPRQGDAARGRPDPADVGGAGCRRVAELPPEVAEQARAVAAARLGAPAPIPTEAPPPAAAPLRPTASPAVARAPARPAGAACDRRVEQLWPSGDHIVGGERYRLVRVFTVDDDRDGRPENVGFLLRAAGRPDVLMFYFDVEGRPSAATVDSLSLEDERDIGRLCFGQVSYDGTDAGVGGRLPPVPAEAEQAGLPGFVMLLLVTAAAASVLLGAGALIGFLVARKRKADRRRRLERRFGERRRGSDPSHTEPERRSGKDRRAGSERRQVADRRGRSG